MEALTIPSEGLELRAFLRQADPTPSQAVIFCHGAFEYQENWFPFAERMQADGFAALTFDFAGHGQSGGLRSLVDLRVWAHNIRDVIGCLAGRGYSRVGLVGWGSGGSAALLASAHDPRVACAAVLATSVFQMPPLAERLAFGLVGAAARLKKAIKKGPITLSRLNELDELRFLADDQANQEYLANPEVRAMYQAVPVPESLDSIWFDITRTVAQIKVPVLVIHGGLDRVTPFDQSQKLFDLLQGPKSLKKIEGSGHALHLDRQADEVNKLIAAWMKRHLKA